MKHKSNDTQASRVGQGRIAFTNKTLTAWGGACSVLAKFLEREGLLVRPWGNLRVARPGVRRACQKAGRTEPAPPENLSLGRTSSWLAVGIVPGSRGGGACAQVEP